MATQRTGSQAAGGLGTALSIGVLAVFVALWVGVAYTVLADPSLPEDAWAWLGALAPWLQVVVWILTLPIPVALWVATSALPPIVGAAMWLGIVAWTAVAVAGVVRRT
jgi:hypothetical protein